MSEILGRRISLFSALSIAEVAAPIPRTPAGSANARKIAQAKGAVLVRGDSQLSQEQIDWNAAVEARKRK